MRNRLGIIVAGLMGLAALGAVLTARAQTTTRCASTLARAETEYRNGAFDAAISQVTDCLNQSAGSTAQQVRAYRLLALAHIKQDELGAAREAIVNLLSLRPSYRPDPVSDPPTYVSIVGLVRRNLQLGPSPLPVRPIQSTAQSSLTMEVPALLDTATPVEQQPEAPPSFYRRTGTWMTIGGVLLGSGVRSGRHAKGLGVGLGVGASGGFSGIGIGGFGVVGGTALTGIMVGGLGVGSGTRIDGIAVGGGGVGTGGRLRGLAIGGLGVGSGTAIRGVSIGGLGVGTGGNLTGLAVALLGVGGGGTVTGVSAAGLGIGAGEEVRGLHVAGLTIFAPQLTGGIVSSVVISKEAVGGFVAPLYLRVVDEGTLTGVSVSLINHVQGRQRGLTIGLLNIADTLQGVQLGVLNYAGNNPWYVRLLPGINMHF